MKTKRLLLGAASVLCLLATNIAKAQDLKKPSSTTKEVKVKYKKHPPLNAASLITFSEYPEGTTITDQYKDQGIIFGPNSDAFITSDLASPTSPVLSGTPIFEGDITGTFVVPGTTNPATVSSFMLDGGYFDFAGSTKLEWYDKNGNSLGSVYNSTDGIETFTVTGNGIASFKISSSESGDLYGIDNVSFESVKDTIHNICLKDNYDYRWHLSYYVNDKGVRIITGKVNLGNGVKWDAYGFWNRKTTKLVLHAINPYPDDCATYTDSFVYTGHGSGFFDENNNNNPVFSGTGTWSSYCGGYEANFGEFSLEDCDHDKQIPLVKTKPGITPAKPGNNAFALQVSPNPVRNNATISYTLGQQSKVSIVIYDYTMQPVKTLVSGQKAAGKYFAGWDGRRSNGTAVLSGLYKVVAVIDGKTYSAGMQVVR